ncbi:hypothetical protein I3760_06G017600 [Carya illinoinensis]|nr:hypothetical protein I3760_06G017600 [Carya illinoinensis]
MDLRLIVKSEQRWNHLNVRHHVEHLAQQDIYQIVRSLLFGKELCLRITNVKRGSSFHVTTTIFFCLSLTFFVMTLGIFINNGAKKFLFSDESYFLMPPLQPSSRSCCLCNNSSSAASLQPNLFKYSSGSRALEDWMMGPEELMWRASMVSRISKYPKNRTRKVAFMFLSRGSLPLGPLWKMFSKGYAGLYFPPEFLVFYKRKIPSKHVEWGQATMMDAERHLLANALLDFSNERFVLLSETCIPLFNFTTIYNYHSFVGSFDDPRPIGQGRYNKHMWPTISLSDWHKGNQWFEVHRKLAVGIDHCKPPCYMDEHYLATLVTKTHSDINSNRSITWVDWSKGGSHPTRFVKKDVSEAFFNRLNCTYNGSMTTVCILFARKFQPNTLVPLLKIAPTLLGFNP